MAKDILFLCGGRSDEHEISLISAKCALDALDRTLFRPIVVGISKKGVWHLCDEKTFYKGELRADKIRLNEDAPEASIAPYPGADGRGKLFTNGRTLGFDAVFPILHGQFGEDGTLQGMLDLVGVPYVGSNCGSSWICMDKVLTKNLCQNAGIPSAEYVWLSGMDELPGKMAAIERLGSTVFVKPSRQGSSVGVSKVTSPAELKRAVEAAFKFDTKVLVEKGIDGREIECAVLGLNKSAQVALPGEIVPAPKVGWYSYEAKYLMDDGAQCLAPAPLEPAKVKEIQEFALKVFRLLECDGLARVDLFLERKTGKVFLNEVNTLPGFTPISMYPKMWQTSGVSYQALVTKLIELAFQRLGKRLA
jgi:D-alanine-D-alanine ligase